MDHQAGQGLVCPWGFPDVYSINYINIGVVEDSSAGIRILYEREYRPVGLCIFGESLGEPLREQSGE